MYNILCEGVVSNSGLLGGKFSGSDKIRIPNVHEEIY